MRQNESVQKLVLAAAQRLCETRDDWTFTLGEVVRSLPEVNEATVRTEVTGRCCVNAPAHHARRWPYFRRVDRGRYRIEPAFRQRPPASGTTGYAPARRHAGPRVAETAPAYGEERTDTRDTLHAVVTESEGWYVAECLELAIVTQARSFDDLLTNLREALALHMDGEDPAWLGLSPSPRLFVSYEARLATD
jgi:predicted RNase H-like HicB family nuclease